MASKESTPPSEEAATTVSNRGRVYAATAIGTTFEWYDFFIYATSAGVVFSHTFFAPAGPQVALILSFATIGLSFLFRPLGAFLAGHFGDLYGRRAMLVVTLLLMGVGTALVGLVPTYESIGIAAPLILIFLRILQGVSAGGEWGGAALMAVEHAPTNRRGIFGSAPQVGVPLGLLLSSGVMAIMTLIAPGQAFLDWGWRIPFLFSIVLIAVGWYVRRRLEESPVFTEITERRARTRVPIIELFRRHWLLVILAAFVFAGSNAAGYMTVGYIQSYATDPQGNVKLDLSAVLLVVTLSSFVWLVMTLVSCRVSDAIGRKATLIIGWILQFIGVLALFPLINTGSIWGLAAALVLLEIGIGVSYGPVATYYAELFPASIRFSGVSITYAIGSILGGAFAPTIAQWLQQATGDSTSVTWYLVGMTAIGLIVTLLIRDRSRIPLGIDHVKEQSTGVFVWTRPATRTDASTSPDAARDR